MLKYHVGYNAEKDCFIAHITETILGDESIIGSYEANCQWEADQWVDEFIAKWVGDELEQRF